MLYKILLALLLLPALSACERTPKTAATQEKMTGNPQAIVEKIRVLDSIPSGSGLAKVGEEFYLVSDDSPYFFRLNGQYKLLQKIAIPGHEKSTAYRLPKPEKPDYESVAVGEWEGENYLFAFGSGSQSPQRDSLLLVNLKEPQNAKTYSLKLFYDLLKAQAQLPNAELNVEGSAIVGEDLFLFNRGQNVLIQSNWPQTVAFLTQKPGATPPDIKTYRLKLPRIKGIDPGFSGACRLGTADKIIFTASVENTRNWIEDGEILGSFIGILDIAKLAENPLESVALLTDKNGSPVVEKVESIEFLETGPDGDLRVIALTDDDKGGSKLLEIRLPKP